jgi:hypothetical protein
MKLSALIATILGTAVLLVTIAAIIWPSPVFAAAMAAVGAAS